MQERLNKLIARSGIASRRQADELIEAGLVTVNGEIIRELGTKADSEKDHIKVRGKLINLKIEKRENFYILLNKPKGVLSSVRDTEGRKLVTDFIPKKFGKLFPVGRLDFNTEGLILLTNDGEFSNLIASSKTIPKVYEVKVKGIPNENAVNKLRRGIRLEDGFKTAPAQINELKATDKNGWFQVTLYEGHNQQIRKMFDAIGHSVVKLRRIKIAHLDDKFLNVGEIRRLSEEELKIFSKPIKQSAPKPEKPNAEPPQHSRALKPKRPKRERKNTR